MARMQSIIYEFGKAKIDLTNDRRFIKGGKLPDGVRRGRRGDVSDPFRLKQLNEMDGIISIRCTRDTYTDVMVKVHGDSKRLGIKISCRQWIGRNGRFQGILIGLRTPTR